MTDPKLWLDLTAAAWLVVVGCMVSTPNTKSALVFKAGPILLAFLLAMSQAKAIF